MAGLLRTKGGRGDVCRTFATFAATLAISLAAIVAIARFTAPEGQQAHGPFDGYKLQDAREPEFAEELEFAERQLRTYPACALDQKQWIGTRWDYLSSQEQDAWTELGWTRSVWDQSYVYYTPPPQTTMTLSPTTTVFSWSTAPPTTTTTVEPPSEDSCYQDLTEAQQDAVRVLGYSIGEWQACKAPHCKWPTGVPLPGAPCLDHLVYLQQKYNYSRSWDSLPPRTREKLVVLGWDPDGLRWEAADIPLTYAKHWSELITAEREAAVFLGYDHKTWAGCYMDPKSPCIARMKLLEDRMNPWIWETMKSGYRARLQELGWSSRSWFEGDQPAIYTFHWDELSYARRLAATLLGYTQDTWMRCPDAPCNDRFSYVTERWSGQSWAEMKLAERRAWMLLGHSEQMWEAGRLPPTMQLRWEELTPEQQVQATYLGHSLGTWQGCNLNWVGTDTSSNNSNATLPDPNAAVRCRMVIQRPYSEISGNVYGAQVATLPTSFIQVFETSVGRALFCGNPPLSQTPETYLTPDGEPLCVMQSNFERQRHRVRVMDVMEGSIVVDFFFVANATMSEPTSRTLFEILQRQLQQRTTSPIAHDRDFGRFAKVATLEERPLSDIRWETMEAAINFEDLRDNYDDSNMCNLMRSAKEPSIRCPTSGAWLHGQSLFSRLLFIISALVAAS